MGKWELTATIVSIAIAGSTLIAGELAADRWVRDSLSAKRPPNLRASNVFVLPDVGRSLPPEPPNDRAVLLMGNSHTYALPGLEKGKPLLLDPGVTLIDRLESEVAKRTGTKTSFYRLCYPNFLPFEMLIRGGYLATKGYDPRLIILGITYRNIARDSEPRSHVQLAFRDHAFAPALVKILEAPEVAADPAVLAAIAKQVEEAERVEREERMRSDADRFNELIVDELEQHVTLIGKSHQMRTLIYRTLTYDIQESFAAEKDEFQYDAVEADLAFNKKSLFALLRMWKARGSTVVIYLTPERGDLPPLVDPAKQEVFNTELFSFAAEQGMIVLDARKVVPDEYWGWMLDSPDRSHFSEKGHQLLGEFLAAEGEKAGVFARLRSAP